MVGWLVGFMVFNDTYNNITVISKHQYYWWKKPEDPEQTTDLSQVTLSHNVVHLALIKIRTCNISGDRH
jgi:hypothetical protein